MAKEYSIDDFPTWQEMQEDIRRDAHKNPERAQELLKASERYEEEKRSEGHRELIVEKLDESLRELGL